MSDILKNENVKILKQGSIDLLVESYSSVATTLQIRGLAEEQAILADITTTSTRAIQTTVIDVANVPIFLTARTPVAGIKRGQLYVKISLRVDGVVVALLIAGYVGDTNSPNYPNGKIENSLEGQGYMRSITGTNPAAGAEITETVPAGAKWKLKAMISTLVTDATVANRVAYLTLDDGANVYAKYSSRGTQAASLTSLYCFGPSVNDAGPTGSYYSVPMPNDILLPAGHRIRTVTLNMGGGDNWDTPQLLVEEFIDP